MSISVYVEAVNRDTPTFGNTNITISENDPDRAAFLENCAAFLDERSRAVDADKFTAAVSQTPSS